jgi:hypothetical protein
VAKAEKSTFVKNILSGSRLSKVLLKREAEKLSSIARGLKCFSFIVCNNAFACCCDELCEKEYLQKIHSEIRIGTTAFSMRWVFNGIR